MIVLKSLLKAILDAESPSEFNAVRQDFIVPG